ncbi:hypothetical protein [Sphingomonas sp.]|uniref:hypothetical protein n=1 Tax=Sphingomonas sp. TaxID=28214 RepID=UPI003D6D8D9C
MTIPAISRYSRKASAKFPFGSNKIPAGFPADSRRTLKKAFSRSNSRNGGNLDRRRDCLKGLRRGMIASIQSRSVDPCQLTLKRPCAKAAALFIPHLRRVSAA